MKKLIWAIILVCGFCGSAHAQNVVNYGYGPVIVQPQTIVVPAVPVVVYKPVVVYQPVQILVPVIQQVPAPVIYPVVPEIRRPCWNHMYQPRLWYYYQ